MPAPLLSDRKKDIGYRDFAEPCLEGPLIGKPTTKRDYWGLLYDKFDIVSAQ